MISERAFYWIAVSVLALFAGNHFAVQHESNVRCLANRSLAAVEHVAGNATRFMTTVETMLSRGGTRFAPAQTTLACAQTRLASVQSMIARREAALARVQAERARIDAMRQLSASVLCPRERLRMVTPASMRTNGTI
jgi:hypothetical protein